MKKYILITIISLIIPSTIFAAGNDVELDSNVIIEIGTYTLNIAGTLNTVEQAEVSETNIILTLNTGSSITITSPTRNQLLTDTNIGVNNTCNSSVSSLVLSGITTVTITPSSQICNDSLIVPVISTYSRSTSGSRISPEQLAKILAPSASTTIYLNSFKTKIVPVIFSTIYPNTTSDLVTTLQTLLTKLGYYSGPITGFYGPLTESAVKKYQIAKKIEPLGFVGPSTRLALNSESIKNINSDTLIINSKLIFEVDLEFGMENLDINKLQTILNKAGFLKVSPNGYFGYQTLAAVKAYQTAHGISSTGYVGHMTRGELSK